jgi:hypothetical protein
MKLCSIIQTTQSRSRNSHSYKLEIQDEELVMAVPFARVRVEKVSLDEVTSLKQLLARSTQSPTLDTPKKADQYMR